MISSVSSKAESMVTHLLLLELRPLFGVVDGKAFSSIWVWHDEF